MPIDVGRITMRDELSLQNQFKETEQVYLAADIQEKLHLGRSKTYEFLEEIYNLDSPPFRVLKIGRLYRVPRRSFDDWLNAS